jgi:hypothetical protein
VDFSILFSILFGEAFTALVLETFTIHGVSIFILHFMGITFPTRSAIHLDLDILTADLHLVEIIWDIRILAIHAVMMFIQNQILQEGGDFLKSPLIIT